MAQDNQSVEYNRGDSQVELVPIPPEKDENAPPIDKAKLHGMDKFNYYRRQFAVEPMVFLYMFSIIGTFPLLQQYVYFRYGNKETSEHSDDTACDLDSVNNTALIEQMDAAQAKASNFIKNVMIISGIPQLIILLFLGAYSDEAGRRFSLILSITGMTLASIVQVFVAFLDLDVGVFFVGAFVSGCTGGVGAMIMGAFAYISDITTRENRTFRIVILESMITLGASFASISTGSMIHFIGFQYPFLIYCLMNCVNFVYIVFFIPEPIPRESKFKLNILVLLNYVKSTFVAYAKKGTKLRRPKLMALLVLFTFINFAGFAGVIMKNLYLLNRPFCWDSLHIGYFSFANSLTTQFGAVGGILLFQRVIKLPELWITFIGFVSSASSLFLFGLSRSSTDLLYASVPVGICSSLPGPMIRGLMSKIVGKDEQGEIFAGLGIIDLLMNIVASLVANAIYKATVSTFPGAIFLFCAMIIYGCAILAAVLYFVIKGYEKFGKYDEDENPENDETDQKEVDEKPKKNGVIKEQNEDQDNEKLDKNIENGNIN